MKPAEYVDAGSHLRLGDACLPGLAQAAPCASEALETALTGKSECLVLRTTRARKLAPHRLR